MAVSAKATTFGVELSGKIGTPALAFPILMMGVGSLIGLVLGWASFAISKKDFQVFFAMFCGLPLGVLGVVLVGKLKCRNRRWACYGTIAGCATSLYVAAVVFITRVYSGSPNTPPDFFWELLVSPNWTWDNLVAIANGGFFSIETTRYGKKTVEVLSPGGIWTQWTFIALMFISTPIVLVLAAMSWRNFCETCQIWVENGITSLRAPLPPDPSVKDALEAGDLTPLLDQPAPEKIRLPWIRVDYRMCECCHAYGVYQLVWVRLEANAAGQQEKKETNVSPVVRVTELSGEQIVALRVAEARVPIGPIAQ